MSPKIAVIAGAGPAGLTAAYELLKRTDIRPIVYEATSAIGGIAQTYNYKGNRIDIGGHRFFSKSERVMNWWFNILPLQGAPAADTETMGHEIDYATEAVVEYLCPECEDPAWKGKGEWSADRKMLRRNAPDPEKEDAVMLQRPRLSRIFYRKNFFPYPIAITFTVACRLGVWNTFLIGMSYLWAQIVPRRDETYLDAFFVNRFGKRLYETFFRDYTEKVWGIPCSGIRADWGAQRVKGLSLKRAVVHAVKDLLSSDFAKAQKERETSLITRFFYPKFGPGQMWETVAEHVRTCGGEVYLRHAVCGVHCENGRVVAATVRNTETGEEKRIACDYFFSTMPIKHLLRMMTPLPSSDVLEISDGLVYRDFITVGLLLRNLHVKESPPSLKLRRAGMRVETRIPDNWIYVQDSDVKVGRIQIFNNWSPYLVSDRKDTVWIGLEYFVNEGDTLWTLPDRDMIDLGTREMEQIGFIRCEDVLDGCVLRIPKTYPAYFGTYDRLGIVQQFVTAIPNLFLIGRNGMHRYNNQDHSMLTAMTAVDNILEGRKDNTNIWDVNADRVYHEEKSPVS